EGACKHNPARTRNSSPRHSLRETRSCTGSVMQDRPRSTSAAPGAAVVRREQTFEPPGGVLVWMIVGIELITFAAGLGVFVAEGRGATESFRAGRQMLNQHLAFANTLVLLTGGWFMAECLT